MIYHPLLLICLPTTKLGFIAPFIAVLSHCPSWAAVAQFSVDRSVQPSGKPAGQRRAELTFSQSPSFKYYVKSNKIQIKATKYKTSKNKGGENTKRQNIKFTNYKLNKIQVLQNKNANKIQSN